MPDFFRDQPMLRLVIGAAVVSGVWALYLARIILGIGPMHDPQGNQAPALHYLGGALIVTAMIAVWILARGFGRQKQSLSGVAGHSGDSLDQRIELELFADYFQFYLQDEQAKGDLSEAWTERAVERLMALAPGTIGVGTVRNMTVPVSVEIRRSEPADDLDAWDQVNDCSIEIPSGRLVVAGCTDHFPDARRVLVPPGCYQARLFYARLDSLSENGLEGDDAYRVVLWPGEPVEPRVVKKRKNLPDRSS